MLHGTISRRNWRRGARDLTLAALLLMISIPAAQAAVLENFDSPQGSDGHVLYRGNPLYTLPVGSSTGGNLNGNAHQNAFILQSFDVIVHDQGGSGFFLYHQTLCDGTPSYAGEVWGTLSTIAVTPNTSYDFSFYLTNRDASSIASIEPFINGQDIGPGTGVHAAGVFGDGNPVHDWQLFSFTWSSGAATTADLSLVDLNGACGGNDFGIDTISFGLSQPTPAAPTTWGRVKTLYR